MKINNFVYLACIILLMQISLVSAWTTNQFNNSATTENLSIGFNENITRYLAIPSPVSFLLSTRLNISMDSGIISYWKLDNNGSLGLKDYKGIRNLSLFNATTVIQSNISGIIGNGSTAYGLANVNKLNYSASGGIINYWDNSNQDGTFSMWIHGSSRGIILGAGTQNLNTRYLVSIINSTSLSATNCNAGITNNSLASSINNNRYYLLSITWNATGTRYYWDGQDTNMGSLSPCQNDVGADYLLGTYHSSADTSFHNITADEMILYNRTLSPSEIIISNNSRGLYLLNNSGLNIGGDSSIELSYNGEFNKTGEIITNLTNSINSYLSTCSFISGFCNVPFQFFTLGGGLLNYANLLFSNDGFIENSRNFTSPVTELQSSNFNINLTYDSGYYSSISGLLVYNGSNYSANKIGTGNNILFNITLTSPYVTATTNFSFYWLIGLINNTGTFYYQSNMSNQTVNDLNIDDCSSNTLLILNYTLRDEDTLALLTPNSSISNTTIELEVILSNMINSSATLTFNKSYSNTNPARVCINSILNSTEYKMQAQARYFATNYVVEFNNIQNATVSASQFPQNIALFDLLTTRSQEFLVIFKDERFLPVSDALITLTRKYVGEGLFRTVEAPLTNKDGQAIIHMVLGDVIYTIQVSKNGLLLNTFNNIVPFCSNIATGDCRINLNAFSTGTQPINFETRHNLTFSFALNKTQRTITTIFATLDGSTALINITGTIFDNRGNTTVCSNSIETSSGSLICTIPVSIGNTTIKINLYKNNLFIKSELFSLIDSVETGFGYTGILMMAIMYITIPLMMITSGTGIVIGAMIGMIFGGLLNLYTGGSVIGITSTLMWFIIAGAIIIWKINSLRKGV